MLKKGKSKTMSNRKERRKIRKNKEGKSDAII